MATTKFKDEIITPDQLKNACVQEAWKELREKSNLLKHYPWIPTDYVLGLKKLEQDNYFKTLNYIYIRWRQIFMLKDGYSREKKLEIVLDKNCPTQERLVLLALIDDFSLEMPDFRPLTADESFARKYPKRIKSEENTLSAEDMEINNALEVLQRLYKKRANKKSSELSDSYLTVNQPTGKETASV